VIDDPTLHPLGKILMLFDYDPRDGIW